MAIINIQKLAVGVVGVKPNIAYIYTNDTIATVTAAGYLNGAQMNGAELDEATMCLVATKTSPSAVSTEVSWLEVSYNTSTKDWSLVQSGTPGSVVLPTIANHIATYTNVSGGLSEDAATAINGGNLQAGLSGTAGYLASFPGTASKGSLRVTAVANTGDTLVTISNAAHGQATVYSIPDVGAATGQFLVKTAALVDGRLIKASGTAGKVVDAGFSLLANTTAAYAGGGTSNAYTATGIGATSIVTASILASTNSVSITKVVPTANTLTVTFSADPGADTTVSWIAITPAV